MSSDLIEHVIGTCRIVHEKPIFSKLIIHGEMIIRKLKVDPRFDYTVGQETGDLCSLEGGDMVAESFPRHGSQEMIRSAEIRLAFSCR